MLKITILFLIFISFVFAAEYDHHSFKKFEHPERSHSIILTPEGFYPDRIFAFEGEKMRIFVTSTMDEPQCFLLKSHELFLSAKKGSLTEGEVVFDKIGEFNYYCPGYEGKGKVVVLGKEEQKKKIHKKVPVTIPVPGRSLASEVEPVEKEWIPAN